MARVIVGTAGHIDHGKSTLVRALTGTDPDRLPEEKRRGITIDLGFAFLDDVAAIIDVPGHERLIRNMVAGAATVDFALLVVAADDGVMPQTVEHLQILNLLGIRSGAVALTKIDAAEPAWIDLVKADIHSLLNGTFLEAAPVFEVDSISGRGLAVFRAELLDLLIRLPARESRGVFRLPIDRVFSIKGRGSVVTGTILSGVVDMQTRLAVLPGGFDVRLKHLESHGREADRLQAGQRAALNLVGKSEALERGRTVTEPGALPVTSRLKVAIEMLPGSPPLKSRQRLRFLIGTQEVIGRIQFLTKLQAKIYANLLLENPVVAVWGDRFVLRRYSPVDTLGGGSVLEPLAPPLRAKHLVHELEVAAELDSVDLKKALAALVRLRGSGGIVMSHVASMFGLTQDSVLGVLSESPLNKTILRLGDVLIPIERYAALTAMIQSRLTALHRQSPDQAGFPRADIMLGATALEQVIDRAFADLVQENVIVRDGSLYHLPLRQVVFSPEQQRLQQDVLKIIERTEFAPPAAGTIADELRQRREAVMKALVNLERSGTCRRLGVDLFFTTTAFDRAITKIKNVFQRKSSLTVADVSALLGSSRKYVVPFLEYLDANGITRRVGDLRVRGPKYDDR